MIKLQGIKSAIPYHVGETVILNKLPWASDSLPYYHCRKYLKHDCKVLDIFQDRIKVQPEDAPYGLSITVKERHLTRQAEFKIA